MAFYQASEFHEGELQIREAMKAGRDDNPTVPAMSPQLANHLQVAPLIAIGTLDKEGRPWTTVWGGEAPVAQSLGGGLAGVRTQVAGRYDPVVEELMGKEPTGQPVPEEGRGRMVSGLTIDLEKRKRVKLFGRLLAGALSRREDEVTGQQQTIAEVQMVLKIEQSLGNCPKYLNRKKIEPALSSPQLANDSPLLAQESIDLISQADLFFVSSSHGTEDMDTNHRGGPQGFLRVLSNDDSGAELVWPEYSGNRLYQTLGNLATTPLAGICIPDFTTGDMLYLTGRTTTLIGPDASAILPKSNLAVKIKITSARHVRTTLPFRGKELDRSPYNPAVRYTSLERPHPTSNSTAEDGTTATLLHQTKITPTVSRFRFRLPAEATYTPGQYATLDFAKHLDIGYSHMRDDDPLSINDDYIRTFTVSSAPRAGETTFEMTIRNVGKVTGFLFQHLGAEKSTSMRDEGLEVALRGFAGEFEVVQEGEETVAFVAAGVGITPLLPSLGTLDLKRLRTLWAVRGTDLPLVAEIVERHPEVVPGLRLFVTGGDAAPEAVEDLKHKGVNVASRRVQKDDFELGDEVKKYYLCAPAPFRKQVMGWIEGKEWIFEDFNF